MLTQGFIHPSHKESVILPSHKGGGGNMNFDIICKITENDVIGHENSEAL